MVNKNNMKYACIIYDISTEEGKREYDTAKRQQAPIEADQFIFTHFDGLLTMLTGEGTKVKIVTKEEHYHFLRQEPEQLSERKKLPDFFQPLINKIITFSDEILMEQFNAVSRIQEPRHPLNNKFN